MAGRETELAGLRRSYSRAGLSEADLAPTWDAQLGRWLADAVAAGADGAERDGAGDGGRRGPPERPHGAAEGPGRARAGAVHPLRQPQGPGGARRRPGRRGDPDARPGAAGHRPRPGREGRCRRDRGLLPQPPPRVPARRLGQPAVRGGALEAVAGRTPGRRGGAVPRAAARCRCRPGGAGCACCPTRWSSGRADRTGCTTGCASAGPAGTGSWSGSPRDRPDPRGGRPAAARAGCAGSRSTSSPLRESRPYRRFVLGSHRVDDRHPGHRGGRAAAGVRPHPVLARRGADRAGGAGAADRVRPRRRGDRGRDGPPPAGAASPRPGSRWWRWRWSPRPRWTCARCGCSTLLVAVQSALFAVDSPARGTVEPRLLPVRLIPAAQTIRMLGFNVGRHRRPAARRSAGGRARAAGRLRASTRSPSSSRCGRCARCRRCRRTGAAPGSGSPACSRGSRSCAPARCC